MSTEAALLSAIQADAADDVRRLVYADWLEERGDERHRFVRGHLSFRKLSPDHVHHHAAEVELSRYRKGCSREWLDILEPERAKLFRKGKFGYAVDCACCERDNDQTKTWQERPLHTEAQDTECDAWKRLCENIEQAARDGRKEFQPLKVIDYDDWRFIVTLPPTIAQLKEVERLQLYGSFLARIPPEISAMTSLIEFDPYTSYALHWYPFEIARCPKLRESRMSTRALYGNFKYHPPFPRLRLDPNDDHIGLECLKQSPMRACAVCSREYLDEQRHRVWITLRVATDDMPLLVNACSRECVQKLPTPTKAPQYFDQSHQYADHPHLGGLGTPKKYR
jgi:uncharacterized protein (TIGR02996 family)